MIDLSSMFAKIVEYAPAVAILLYLNWRAERALTRVLEWCLGELTADDPEENQ